MEFIDIMEAMQKRHSVRSYTVRPIEAEKLAILQETIEMTYCDVEVCLIPTQDVVYDVILSFE